jgi:hypothetical protein
MWWVSFPFQENPMPRTPSPELARQWRDRVCRFEHCGLTVAEFCQREGYSAASFYQWRRRLADASEFNRKDAFVSVELSTAALTFPSQNEPGEPTDLRIELRIELPGGVLVRLDADATDQQQCRLIRNIIRSLREVD